MSMKTNAMYASTLSLFALSSVCLYGQAVKIMNTTSGPVWVTVKKAGKLGVDSSVKDVTKKLEPLTMLSEDGKNITDIYVCPDKGKELNQDTIQKTAAALGLHETYSTETKRIFIVNDNDTLKLQHSMNITNDYPHWKELIKTADKDGSTESNPWVGQTGADLIALFKKISPDGFKLRIYDPNKIISDKYDEKSARTILESIGEFIKVTERISGFSHFQGIMRLPTWLNLGNYFVLPGGTFTNDPKTCIPNLFLAKLDSQTTNKPLKESTEAIEKEKNTIIGQISNVQQDAQDAKTPYWHPGGVGICGKYLVVPVCKLKHKEDGTKIQIYDIGIPEKAQLIFEIVSPLGSATTTMTRLPNNYYLLALMAGSHLDFYLSKTTNMKDGFYSLPTLTMPTDGMIRKTAQNINFITSGDGELFIAATDNTSVASPISKGDDKIWLYRVTYNCAKMEEINTLIAQGKKSTVSPYEVISTDEVIELTQKCGDWCSFKAGGEVYPISRTQLEALGIAHWVDDDKVKIQVYHPK